jgi:hypothetical protein
MRKGARVSDNPNPGFILPVGTQVVMLVQIIDSDSVTLYPRGAVSVIVQSPSDDSHSY